MEEIIKRFRSLQEEHCLFPEARHILQGKRLITSFSHANPNLPIDEINGMYHLDRLMERLDLEPSQVLCIIYDNCIPFSDSPKGHRIQYGSVNPVIMNSHMPYSFQKDILYDREAVFKNGENMVESIPDTNRASFIRRFRRIDDIYIRRFAPGDPAPVEKIREARRELMGLIRIGKVAEVPFSSFPTVYLSELLACIYSRGYPFWEMPLPPGFAKYRTRTYLVEGIDRSGRRVPVGYDGRRGRFRISGGEEIHRDDIFESIRQRRVIPTMPLIVLGLMVAPQIMHLGGGFWPRYAVPIARELSSWLGLGSDAGLLAVSTGGLYSPYVYRYEKRFYGFPLLYMHMGEESLAGNLNRPGEHAVRYQKQVYA